MSEENTKQPLKSAEDFTKYVSPTNDGIRQRLLNYKLLRPVHDWMSRFASIQILPLLEEIARLKDVVSVKNEQIAKLKEDNAQLQIDANYGDMLLTECENLKSEVIVLEHSLSLSKKENEELKAQNKKLGEEVDFACINTERKNKYIAELEDEVKFHCVEKDKLEKELTFEKSNANEFAKTADEYRNVINQTRSELSLSKKENEELKETNNNFHARINDDREIKDVLRRELTSVKEQNQKITEALEKIKSMSNPEEVTHRDFYLCADEALLTHKQQNKD